MRRRAIDHRFGPRYTRWAVLCIAPAMVPLFLMFGNVLVWWMGAPLFVVFMGLGIWMLQLKFRHTHCPECGVRIALPWATDPHYLRREALRYYCPRCDIEWNTNITPGTD